MTMLSGMTGFSSATGTCGDVSWTWEAKSVNGRGLDIRLALPPGFEALEREVKRLAGERFSRGSLQVSLRIDSAAEAGGAMLNEPLLSRLVALVEERSGARATPEAIASLLSVRGVLDTGARFPSADESVLGALTESAALALDQLGESRNAEGAQLATLLLSHLDEMTRLTGQAKAAAAGQPELLKAKLTRQLDVLDPDSRVDPDRFAAEAALSAARADVREELDRLDAHIGAARDLIAGGSPAGRKLDFLAQELNREANTLCSKSVSVDLTNAGLSLKGMIDQFKEQAANVE